MTGYIKLLIIAILAVPAFVIGDCWRLERQERELRERVMRMQHENDLRFGMTTQPCEPD